VIRPDRLALGRLTQPEILQARKNRLGGLIGRTIGGQPKLPGENDFELSAPGVRVSVPTAQLQVSRCAMYQFSADESELGWFLNFIAWWCSLFDSQDIAIIKTAAAVVIAGILLLVGAFMIKLLGMIVVRVFRM
jgi:hypothetical protein